MNFLDILALFLVILILLVIVNNIMLHGRDLAKYPRRAEKDIQRDIDNYYKHHPHKTHQFPAKGHKLNPSHVAQYVSSHLPSSH
jgi:hypothetical protein